MLFTFQNFVAILQYLDITVYGIFNRHISGTEKNLHILKTEYEVKYKNLFTSKFLVDLLKFGCSISS